MVRLVAAHQIGQVEPMIKMAEHRALEYVCSRLIKQFPDRPTATVRLAVREVHARFDGRVRDDVPILGAAVDCHGLPTSWHEADRARRRGAGQRRNTQISGWAKHMGRTAVHPQGRRWRELTPVILEMGRTSS
jgi:hypothetical protein